jgi:hypothetical protein
MRWSAHRKAVQEADVVWSKVKAGDGERGV